jgi:hypothetical protein
MASAAPIDSSERSELRVALDTLIRVVRSARPRAISGEEAREIVALLAEAERACASGIALFSPRVVETGAFAKAGYASGPDWLGAVSGTSASAARSRLTAAERAQEFPEVADALHHGALSTPQLNLVTSASSFTPSAAPTLLGLVDEHASHQQLAEEAARLKACARSMESERARRARVRAARHLRWHQAPGGGVRGEFLCDEADWARVAPSLEAATKARCKAADATCADTYEAHRLDALLALLSTGGAGAARPRVLVHVSAEALRRGTTTTGEICEIAGIGPVPVEAVRELLGEGCMEFVLTEGTDVRAVTRASRDLAQKTATALAARDRVCVVPGCGKRLGLEADHCKVDFARGGATSIDNLARLCGPHHAMKTHGGWKLGGGPGYWTWTPPPRAPSAGAIARARKVAAAKASRK